jgi:hypothetical protein
MSIPEYTQSLRALCAQVHSECSYISVSQPFPVQGPVEKPTKFCGPPKNYAMIFDVFTHYQPYVPVKSITL